MKSNRFISKITLSLMFSFLSLFLYCQVQTKNLLLEANKDSDYGLVHIFYIGNALDFEPVRIFIDDKKVCKLNPRRFSSHLVIPGHREFEAFNLPAWFRKQEQGGYFNIKAGETHYLLVGYVSESKLQDIALFTTSLIALSQGSGAFNGKIGIVEELDRNNALLYIDKFQLKPDKKY